MVSHYELTRLLGEGGLARTFLASDTRTGERLAVKELQLLKSREKKQIELFERECATLRDLDHPQIPRFADTVVERHDATLSLFLVQEFIDGRSLQQLLDAGQRFTASEVVAFMISCLQPLEYLHTRNPPLYHRDIKPSNVILQRGGECVLVDFGAVRQALTDPSERGSSVVGTFGYMAPEQFQAKAFPATDLYAVGATAFHLLTGVEPARLELNRLKPNIHPFLTDTDVHLTAILDLLLEPAVEDRYASVESLVRALKRWEQSHGGKSKLPDVYGESEDAYVAPTVSPRTHPTPQPLPSLGTPHGSPVVMVDSDDDVRNYGLSLEDSTPSDETVDSLMDALESSPAASLTEPADVRRSTAPPWQVRQDPPAQNLLATTFGLGRNLDDTKPGDGTSGPDSPVTSEQDGRNEEPRAGWEFASNEGRARASIPEALAKTHPTADPSFRVLESRVGPDERIDPNDLQDADTDGSRWDIELQLSRNLPESMLRSGDVRTTLRSSDTADLARSLPGTSKLDAAREELGDDLLAALDDSSHFAIDEDLDAEPGRDTSPGRAHQSSPMNLATTVHAGDINYRELLLETELAQVSEFTERSLPASPRPVPVQMRSSRTPARVRPAFHSPAGGVPMQQTPASSFISSTVLDEAAIEAVVAKVADIESDIESDTKADVAEVVATEAGRHDDRHADAARTDDPRANDAALSPSDFGDSAALSQALQSVDEDDDRPSKSTRPAGSRVTTEVAAVGPPSAQVRKVDTMALPPKQTIDKPPSVVARETGDHLAVKDVRDATPILTEKAVEDLVRESSGDHPIAVKNQGQWSKLRPGRGDDATMPGLPSGALRAVKVSREHAKSLRGETVPLGESASADMVHRQRAKSAAVDEVVQVTQEISSTAVPQSVLDPEHHVVLPTPRGTLMASAVTQESQSVPVPSGKTSAMLKFSDTEPLDAVPSTLLLAPVVGPDTRGKIPPRPPAAATAKNSGEASLADASASGPADSDSVSVDGSLPGVLRESPRVRLSQRLKPIKAEDRVPVAMRHASALAMMVPGGQGARAGGLFLAAAGLGAIIVAKFTGIESPMAPLIIGAALLAYASLLLLMPRSREGYAYSQVQNGPIAPNAKVVRIVRVQSPVAVAEWVAEYEFAASDGLQYTGKQRLAGADVARKLSTDANRIAVRYHELDPGVSALMPR